MLWKVQQRQGLSADGSPVSSSPNTVQNGFISLGRTEERASRMAGKSSRKHCRTQGGERGKSCEIVLLDLTTAAAS